MPPESANLKFSDISEFLEIVDDKEDTSAFDYLVWKIKKERSEKKEDLILDILDNPSNSKEKLEELQKIEDAEKEFEKTLSTELFDVADFTL